MNTPKTMSPPAPVTQSKTTQLLDVAATSLEAALKILELLANVTENVPYIGAITGCIQKLINIQKAMGANKKSAKELFDNIGELSRVVAQGLYDLDTDKRSIAIQGLSADLNRYQMVLSESCDILTKWSSQSRIELIWKHSDFPDIVASIDRRINTFRNAFSAARLISLSRIQDILNLKIQTVVDLGVRAILEKWIQSPRVDQSQSSASGKRHPGTGLWLLKECPEFQEWVYPSNSNFFWLYGISGCGKTILSSAIIDTLRNRAKYNVFFYFDTNTSDQHTVKQLLCSVVTQLSVLSPAPDKTLSALWDSYGRGQHFPSNSALVSEALIPILTEFKEPVYIVLDALDECSERTELLRVITTILDAKLFNVHLLVTSRPEVPHGSPLVQRAVAVSLEGCADDDIDLYVTEILSKEVGWLHERKEEIRQRLLERGKGMFRLISLQLDELRNCDGRRSQVDKALEDLPNSLNTIYARILQNINNPDMLSAVFRTMNWLMFSKRYMALDEIIDALAFDFKCEPLLFDTRERMRPDALLTACAGFVTMWRDGGQCMVKIAHSSVKEYFLLANQPRLSGDCEISEQAAHHLIAQTCIAYLCSFNHALHTEADLRQYPLTLYAVENWMFHLTLCDDIGLDNCGNREKDHKQSGLKQVVKPKVPNHTSHLIDAVMHLLRPDTAQYTTLLYLYAFGFSPHLLDKEERSVTKSLSSPPTPPLFLAVSVGIGQVVLELLQQGADVNVYDEDGHDGYYGSALRVAAYIGYTEIARLLLESGAVVNIQGGLYGNPLQCAAYQGHTDIVRLLLASGADVNAQGGYYGNALQAACFTHHTEIAHLLLDSGADVNRQGGYCGNALQAAAGGTDVGIVHRLLESGADVNMQGGFYGNALQMASIWGRGRTDIVCLLLERGADVNAQGGYLHNALQGAAGKGNTEIARMLLNSGADVNRQGGMCVNALIATSYGGDMDLAHLLLQSGADVNAQGGYYGNALTVASLKGHTKFVCLLLERNCDVNAQSGRYGTALQAASYRGHLGIVGLLLARGADVNIQGGEWGTALEAASIQGHTEIACLLLEMGAEVYASSEDDEIHMSEAIWEIG
ncbi:ankyrin repeat-containing domain protein [Mycena rebaudengoi]|nr:ankyrin repeat-containing domain protein [Mycena rebaudengoi]